jgi:hypothetical protein
MKPPIETPFPRHWLRYIVIKLLVLVVAGVLFFKYQGYW